MSGLLAAAIFPARNEWDTSTSASARLALSRTPASMTGWAGRSPADGVSAETPVFARSPTAARRAFSTTAPSRAGRRALMVTAPSSSTRTDSRRRSWASWSSALLTRRCAAVNRSSWEAVIGPASSARSDSVWRVAMRVSARTLAYDIRPAVSSPVRTGRSRRALATRTCSRAAPRDSWHFQASQAAQDPWSQLAQPWRASNSPMRTRNRPVAAARCPASSQICASSRSSGRAAGSGSERCGSVLGMTNSSIMCLTIAVGTDSPAAQPRSVMGSSSG